MTRLTTTAIVAALLATLLAAPALALEKPKLIFTTEEHLAKLRGAIEKGSGHHARAFAALKARVDKGDLSAYTSENKYDKSYGAREAAFAYLITRDDKYAKRAYEIVESVYTDKKQRATPLRKSGLNRAMMSIGVAIPYNWCWDAWTPEQRKFVKGKIDEALHAWQHKFGHANVRRPYVSNWAAVTRGGELIMMICAGEVENRKKRYDQIKSHLEQHMKFGFGDLGVSQEGVGYTEYPGGFLLPAVYAAKSIGDDELWKVAQTRDWWKLAMYSHTFQPHERKFLQQGVSHTSNFDEGWVSLLLNDAPAEQLPYYVYWYDRHMGVKAPGTEQDKYDSQRAGTVWSVLYYPLGVEPKDPTGVYPIGVADQRGYHFFRNRWKDENDILTACMGDEVHHSHAWDQPENLAIDLMAYNTRFIGGPGKKRDHKLYSSLLVDGKYNVDRSVRLTGGTVAFEADTSEGYVIVDGGKLYKALGVEDAKRHMALLMSAEHNNALISTLDRVKSDKEHTYTWQINLGSDQDDDEVKATTVAEAGRKTIILRGRNKGFVKAWVVHPVEAKIEIGDPTRVNVKGANQDIWVLMAVGAGDPPTAKVAGEGMDATVTVGTTKARFDSEKGRIVIDGD